MSQNERVLIVGGGAREHVLGATVARYSGQVWVAMANRNPGLWRLAGNGNRVIQLKDTEVDKLSQWALDKKIDLAFIGPEAGLGAGLVDAFNKQGIPAVGPTKTAAQLEVDKRFMRSLLEKHMVPGRLSYQICETKEQVHEFLQELDSQGLKGVVKPVGLTGGKGVKVMGDQLGSIDEAVEYADQIIHSKISGFGQVVIEERAVGQEITLQGFCDGKTVAPMPAAQDHPHANEGDVGAITGGMGSYTQPDGLLPFLKQGEYDEALDCMKTTVKAMNSEGRPYHGFLYGQFIITAQGPKVVEFNARFGDPEAMNILPLLDHDLLDLGYRIAEGRLPTKVAFDPKASVCKYIVPQGYGTSPVPPAPMRVDEERLISSGCQIYYAAVNLTDDNELYTTTSRACGVVGFGDDIDSAEHVCESGLKYVIGKHLFVRHDIATPASLAKRVNHMNGLRQ